MKTHAVPARRRGHDSMAHAGGPAITHATGPAAIDGRFPVREGHVRIEAAIAPPPELLGAADRR